MSFCKSFMVLSNLLQCSWSEYSFVLVLLNLMISFRMPSTNFYQLYSLSSPVHRKELGKRCFGIFPVFLSVDSESQISSIVLATMILLAGYGAFGPH